MQVPATIQVPGQVVQFLDGTEFDVSAQLGNSPAGRARHLHPQYVDEANARNRRFLDGADVIYPRREAQERMTARWVAGMGSWARVYRRFG